MRKVFSSMIAGLLMLTGAVTSAQETAMVTVTVENIAPQNGVAITPVWVGFHSGSFDSYNGGLTSLPGLERLAEDGNTSLISSQFLDFDPLQGGYTYIDTSAGFPESRLVRTGDRSDEFRQDATLGAAPLQPGQSASQVFELRTDGSNDFFSYASMVLPTNDFFIANGSPVAHSVSDILSSGGELSFFIGTPNGGANDAGTETENFAFSAGNPLFPGRRLPLGQSGPDQGQAVSEPIANVIGDPFVNFVTPPAPFRLNNQSPAGPNLAGLDFNQYTDGIGRVTITVEMVSDAAPAFVGTVPFALVTDGTEFVEAAEAGNLYFNVHTADFPGGEIRGQLDNVLLDVRQANGFRILCLTAELDGAQEPDNASDSTATGQAFVKIIVLPQGQAFYVASLTVEGIAVDDLIPVAVFSAIHIHNAPRGVNGGVVQDFIVDAGGTTEDFSILNEIGQ